MFGIGGFELFIIVVFIFLVFGPDKLPEFIKIAGLAIKKFRKAKNEMDKVLKDEIVDPVMKEANKPDTPQKNKISSDEKQVEKGQVPNRSNSNINVDNHSESSNVIDNKQSSEVSNKSDVDLKKDNENSKYTVINSADSRKKDKHLSISNDVNNSAKDEKCI